MRQATLLGFSLCLTGVVVLGSLNTATSAKTVTREHQTIAQLNACAGRGNPCAGKVGNVGGPLARQLQGKPVVVDIYASWCAACQNIAPTLSQLKQQYEGKVHFIVLDVSDQAKANQAEAKAKELGLGEFFAQHKSQTGMVAIIDPGTGNILAQHRNNPKLEDYTSVINTAIAQR